MKKILLLLLLFLALSSCAKQKKSPPKAIKGVIDLSNWDFEQDGPINLRGEWGFYYKRLLKPDEIHNENENKIYISIPGSWSHYKLNNKKLDSFAYGTYVLKIKGLKKSNIKLGLDVKEIFTSSQVYFIKNKNEINVDPIISTGVVSENSEISVAEIKYHQVEIPSTKEDSYLLIHVSNYKQIKAGITNNIKLGVLDDLRVEHIERNYINYFILGIMFIMSIYHLALYSSRRQARENLYFSLLGLIMTLRLFMISRFYNQFYPDPSNIKFEIMSRTLFLTIFVSLPLYYTFLSNVFKEEFSEKLKKLIWYLSAIMIFEALFLPPSVYTGFSKDIYLLVALIYMIFALLSIVRAVINKRLGSRLSLLSVLVGILFSVNDIFVTLGVFGFSVFVVQYALVFFIFTHSYILSQKFAKAFTDLEETTKEKVSLVELDKQKTLFFQNISHELRTPLTLILNPLQEAYEKYKDDLHEMALKNTNRLYRLVNQLLDFQKLSQGKMNTELLPVNLNKFMKLISDYFNSMRQVKKIDFSFTIPPEKDIYIMGNIDALEKVILNYLSNAIKYTPDGGKISIDLKEVEENRVRISVIDNGIGISRVDQSKLFQVFSQVDGTSSRDFEGTGLGLALVKELTEELGGKVGVESKKGLGSTFFVEFPKIKLKHGVDDSNLNDYRPKKWHLEDPKEFKKESENDDILEGDGELILIADDLKDMRELLTNSLRKKKFRVIKAINGEDALSKAREHKPDLIITDWMMPQKTGVELIEDIKADSSIEHTPTILLTAKSDDESKLIGTQTGASAYIGKPFDELELLSTVENLLNLKKGEEKIKKLNRELSENVLKRFLPPSLVDSIVDGKEKIDDSFKSTTLTILFSDISSFSKISHEIGPQNVAKILNEYLNHMSEVIFSFDGTIDKIIGDSMMVLWGAPKNISHNEQILRAYRCSLKMQDTLADLNEKWKKEGLPELKKRIGIHHGSAIVGYFGGKRRSDYTAIGTSINMAQRIEGVANPGEIFISSVVRDILPQEAKWEKAGTFSLKGISDNETLYKIIS